MASNTRLRIGPRPGVLRIRRIGEREDEKTLPSVEIRQREIQKPAVRINVNVVGVDETHS